MSRLSSGTSAGFTLIELMIVLVILAVTLTLAAPAFQEIQEANRLQTTASTIVTAVNFAKSEAVTRNDDVYMCPSSDGSTCSGNYEGGWILHIGTDATTPTQVLRVFDGIAAQDKIRGSDGAAVTAALTFRPDGSGTAQVFTVCPPDLDAGVAWGVDLSVVGRPRVRKGDAAWKCSAT